MLLLVTHFYDLRKDCLVTVVDNHVQLRYVFAKVHQTHNVTNVDKLWLVVEVLLDALLSRRVNQTCMHAFVPLLVIN